MSETNTDLCEIHRVGKQTREWIVSFKACPALSLYGIGLVGVTHAAPDFRFVRPHPVMSQLLLCFAGEGRVWIDGTWQPCGPGQAYVTPPSTPHGYHALAGARWKLCWVIYASERPHSQTFGIDQPVLMSGECQTLATAIESLHRETMTSAEPGVMNHWAALIDTYAQRLIRPVTRLKPVWDAVRADLAHPWSLTELSEILEISPEQLRRLSLTEVAKSPMRYVTELRMREAAALLSSESYSIAEVAERIGYDDPFAFSTAFKRCVGQPPSLYRDPQNPHFTR